MVAGVTVDLAKVLGPSPMGRRPAGWSGGAGEVLFRHSMACPKTQLAVAPSEKPSRTFLKFGTMNDPATGP